MDMQSVAQDALRFVKQLRRNLWIVPCVLDPETNQFMPTITGLQINQSEYRSKEWLPSEDRLLVELITKYGARNWVTLARIINDTFHGGANTKSSKQCRGRWINHLDPNLKKSAWSPSEDAELLSLHKQMGRKWSVISKAIAGRNENAVKNRYYALLKQSGKGKQESEEEPAKPESSVTIQLNTAGPPFSPTLISSSPVKLPQFRSLDSENSVWENLS